METLSNRGLGAVKPMLPYLKQFLNGLKDLHDPVENPGGYVLLAVAENRLSCGFAGSMIPKLREAANDAITASTGAYGDFSGAAGFREAFSAVCRRTFLKTLPASAVSADDLIVSSGCGSVINNLCMSLLEAGDGVMLPTPTYAALPNDVGVLAKGVIVRVPTEGTGFKLTRGALDSGYEAGLAAGHRPRMLLLLHPNNPLGTVYSRAELEMAADWCLEKGRLGPCSAEAGCCGAICSLSVGAGAGAGAGAGGARRCPFAGAGALHLVVDEIYANSIHPGSGVRFESIVEIMHDRATSAAAAAAAASPAAAGGSGGGATASAEAGSSSTSTHGASEAAAAGGAAVALSGGSGDAAATSEAAAAPVSASASAVSHVPVSSSPLLAATPSPLRFLGNHVHAIWGLSKDWAMSGYRVGMLHSHNAALKAAVGGINYFSGVSGDTLDRLAAVMRDGEWCERYLANNAAALGRACELVCGLLKEAGIPFTPAVAGMFVWADLRRYLPGAARAAARKAAAAAAAAAPAASALSAAAPGDGNASGTLPALTAATAVTDWAAERALTTAIYERAKVLLTPGEACLAAEPGFYRICFAWMPEESVRTGFARLTRVLLELESA